MNSKHNSTPRAAAKKSRKTSKLTASTYGIPPGPFAQTVDFLQQAFLLSFPPLALSPSASDTQAFDIVVGWHAILQYLAHIPGTTILDIAAVVHPYIS